MQVDFFSYMSKRCRMLAEVDGLVLCMDASTRKSADTVSSRTLIIQPQFYRERVTSVIVTAHETVLAIDKVRVEVEQEEVEVRPGTSAKGRAAPLVFLDKMGLKQISTDYRSTIVYWT